MAKTPVTKIVIRCQWFELGLALVCGYFIGRYMEKR